MNASIAPVVPPRIERPLERLAEVLVDYSTRVRRDDVVVLAAPALAGPLVREVYEAILRAGAHPLPRLGLDGLGEALLGRGSEEQLAWVNPVRKWELERADVYMSILADWNTKSLSAIEPERQAIVARAQDEMRARFLERAAAGEVRWVLTAFPTHAAAQDAEMSLEEYGDFVYRAALLDHERPADRWRELGERLKRVADFLSARKELRIVADGTDLRLRTEGRTWVPSDGHENFPDGEVFTGPIETSLEGTIAFTYPAVFQRREVEDVRLRFEGGEVVEASARRGQDFLEEMIGMDDGARRAGEFAFGLNEGISIFTRNTLFDEKIGGTAHLALGQSYPETGGKNRSALHWDMICDLRAGSEVYADGELVYRDGSFLESALG
ncbi:MAG: aminopeptidase [Actinobacteria bacterium]|nr:aminopeptidase [Actinomycetota bacterium]